MSLPGATVLALFGVAVVWYLALLGKSTITAPRIPAGDQTESRVGVGGHAGCGPRRLRVGEFITTLRR